MTDEPLTHEEIKELRKMIRFADQIEAEMEFKAAKRLLLKTWRSVIIGLAGVIGAFLMLQESLRQLIRGWLGP